MNNKIKIVIARQIVTPTTLTIDNHKIEYYSMLMTTAEGVRIFGPGLPDEATHVRPITAQGDVLLNIFPVTRRNLVTIADALGQASEGQRYKIVGFIPANEDGTPVTVVSPEGEDVIPRIYTGMALAGNPRGTDGRRYQAVSTSKPWDPRQFIVDLAVDTVIFEPNAQFAADSPYRTQL